MTLIIRIIELAKLEQLNSIKTMDQIINALKVNPIFKMSLGSKELFHSNFLEYLWDVDQEEFKKLINDVYPNTFDTNTNYLLGREKKNFDICIYHKIKGQRGGEKDVYDLIIENKVKSIPYKEQLDEYNNEAIKNNKNCRFILLSLSDKIPDLSEIKKQWEIVKYDILRDKIENHYLNNPNICSTRDKEYITDYCIFIEQMNKLVDKIIPNNIFVHPLFEENDIDKLKKIRLHDLYIKLRCSWFVIELKKRITQNTQIIHKFSGVKQNQINLNIDINQGNGQIAAWICDNKNNVFEIVIQGDQYRHGINQRMILTPSKIKGERLNELYDKLKQLSDKRPLEFLNFNGNNNVEPHTIKKFRDKNSTLMKSGPFNCYGEDYIYRYIEANNHSTNMLLTMMLNDINAIFANIPCLY